MGNVKKPFSQALILGLAIDLYSGRGFDITMKAYNYDRAYFEKEMKRCKYKLDQEIEHLKNITDEERYGCSFLHGGVTLI